MTSFYNYSSIKILYFIFFPLVAVTSIHAQITFNNSYGIYDNSNINSEAGWEVLVDEEGYTVLALQFCSNNGPYCTGVLKTDFEGEVIWEKVFSNPLHLRAGGRFIHTPDGGYAIAGDQYVGNSEYRFFLLRLDNKGDSLWLKFYGDNDIIKDFPRNVVQTPNNGFIIHGDGGIPPNGIADKSIVVTDSLGNQIWEKNLGLTNSEVHQNQLGDLVLLPDGTMAIGYMATFDNPGSPDSVSLVKLTANGEILWTKHYYLQSTLCGPRLKLLPTGNFLISGCKVENGFDYQATFLVLDQEGNIIKEKNRLALVAGSIFDIALTSNGDILACGRNDSMIVADVNLAGFGAAAWILRLDSNLNILWDRNYVSLSHGYGSTFNSIKEAPDGGIIVAGGPIKDTLEGGGFDPNIWLVKLDGDGCLHPGCGEEEFIYLAVEDKEGIGIGKQAYFLFFPNPVSNFMKIKLLLPQTGNGVINLYSPSGALLRSETLQKGVVEQDWDLSNYPPGLYFLILERNGLVVQSEKVVVR